MSQSTHELNEQVQRGSQWVQPLFSEVGKVVVGQKLLVERLITGLLTNGHVLLEGVPGLAKTLTVRTLASCLHTGFSRLQFTPDLLPADLIGTLIYNPRDGEFSTKLGPIFSNLILADEINRAPAKVQSALLEAMQERQVTLGDKTYKLPDPFLVLATMNPLEQEGTYQLPEAQLDRFMLNIVIDYLSEDEEVAVVTRTTSGKKEPVHRLFTGEQLQAFQQVVKKVPIAEDVARYAVKLAASSRPNRPGTPDFVNEWVSWGAGTRASQNLVLGAKTRALIQGRAHVTLDDIRALALPVLRHRILINYRAEAEGVTVAKVIGRLIESLAK